MQEKLREGLEMNEAISYSVQELDCKNAQKRNVHGSHDTMDLMYESQVC